MLNPVLICAVGLVMIIFAFWKFGGKLLRSSPFSKGGLVLAAGMAVVIAGTKYGDYKWNHLNDRAVFERKIAQMLHRAPDRLELEGSTLEDFHGMAYVNGKRYEVKSKLTAANDKEMKYDVIVTPVTSLKSD
jgi:hypothetical protein